MTQWYALFAPAPTAPAIVKRLHGEVVKAIAEPAVNKRLIDIGTEPVGSTPEQLAAQVQAELRRWSSLFKTARIKIE